MIVTGKKKQAVKHGIQMRGFRPSSPSFATHGSMARSSDEDLSEDFLRLLVRSVAGIVFAAFVLGLLLHWRISREAADLVRLAAVRASVAEEHARLLAQRNELMSKSRIAAAAKKLGLQLPDKDQEHRLH